MNMSLADPTTRARTSRPDPAPAPIRSRFGELKDKLGLIYREASRTGRLVYEAQGDPDDCLQHARSDLGQ